MLMVSILFLLTACGVEETGTNMNENDHDTVTETSAEAEDTGDNVEAKEKEKEEKEEKENKKQKQTSKKQTHPKKTTNGLAPLTIHYIDVGQADATLFTYESDGENYTILFDTGDWKRNDTVEYLADQGITALDLVIISHPDADHIGQLPDIIDTFDVGEVWMSGNESTSETFQKSIEGILANDIDYHEPRAGEDYEIGNLQLKIVHPSSISGKANEESVSIQFTYGEKRFLFTGDADIQAESEMIGTGIDLKSHVFQLGHHGSDTSNGQEFIDAVQPEVAIFSAGVDSQYGHPHQDVIERLKQSGVKIYGTATDGNILVTTDGKTYSINTGKKKSVSKERSKTNSPSNHKKTTQSEKKPSDNCININQASAEDLQKITNIGPKRAEDVIANRPYKKLDELSKVNGIGEVRLQEIKEEGLACVN